MAVSAVKPVLATVGFIESSSVYTGYGNHVALCELKCVTVACVDTGKDIGSILTM